MCQMNVVAATFTNVTFFAVTVIVSKWAIPLNASKCCPSLFASRV